MTTSHEAARQRPHQLDPRRRALYDAIVGGPRGGDDAPFRLTDDAGALRGPFAAMLLSPEVGDAVQRLGAALRYGSVLDARLREVAILTVARLMKSVFEQTAHEEVGRRLGFSEAELASLRREDAGALLPRERRCAALIAALTSGAAVVATDFEGDFTPQELYELTVIGGYYRMLASQLHFFELDEPAR